MWKSRMPRGVLLQILNNILESKNSVEIAQYPISTILIQDSITCHERLQTVVEFFSSLLERPAGVVACARVVEAGNEPSHRPSTSRSVMVRVNTDHHQNCWSVTHTHTNSLANKDYDWLNNTTTPSQNQRPSHRQPILQKTTTPIFLNKIIGWDELLMNNTKESSVWNRQQLLPNPQ